VKKFWSLFFVFWPILAIWLCWVAPERGWWFPGESKSSMGHQIDGLFYLILIIVTVTFVGTQIALGWALWRGATKADDSAAAFSHGNHKLEVIWSAVPAFVLVFISVTQLEVLANIRVMTRFPDDAVAAPVAEVTARQFEWRMRYPAPGTTLSTEPGEGDLYYVNELHVPVARPVLINLRTQDVQHSFFAPQLRVKQDAVPGLVIPVWFDIEEAGEYDLVCAELCGWGHYKMKARIIAGSDAAHAEYVAELSRNQFDDGFSDAEAESGEGSE
jgi:cytochrome c oxidase subunit 2